MGDQLRSESEQQQREIVQLRDQIGYLEHENVRSTEEMRSIEGERDREVADLKDQLHRERKLCNEQQTSAIESQRKYQKEHGRREASVERGDGWGPSAAYPRPGSTTQRLG